MRRNIRDRVDGAGAVSDVRPRSRTSSSADDGRLSWMMDAFTTSGSLPVRAPLRARHARASTTCATASRRSIDAYDGTTTFYVFDTADPILAAYRAMFPTLFKDASTMPAGPARSTSAIPSCCSMLQAAVYGLYHMTDPRGVLQPRGSLDGRERSRRCNAKREQAHADGAELRPDEAARRDEHWSSSRFCRSRRPTATT